MEQTIRLEKVTPRGDSYALKISTLEDSLMVSAETVYRHRLTDGIVLTAPQLQQLQSEAEVLRCDTEVARLLSMREHSIAEIRMKLRHKQFDRDVSDEVILKYTNLGLLDDARYAAAVARRSIQRNPSGRPFLVAVLRKKGIGRSLAEKTIDDLLRDTDEETLAVESLQKRWSTFSQLELERARQKAYTYLSRRGIGYAAAKAAFEKLYNRE